MSTEPIIRGTFADITEQPGSPEYNFSDTETCVRVFEGPFDACLSAAPRRGSTMAGSPEGMLVTDSKVIRKEADVGQLIVNLERSSLDGSDPENPAVTVTYELDWQSIDRPIWTNPRYRDSGLKPLSEADLANIIAWRDQEFAARKKFYNYPIKSSPDPDNNDHFDVLSANAFDCAAKILKGQDSYREYYPLARVNSTLVAMPDTTPCGIIIEGKPFSQCPDGYVWMKTADRPLRSGRSGRWIRNVEYTGSRVIDTDLYDVEASP